MKVIYFLVCNVYLRVLLNMEGWKLTEILIMMMKPPYVMMEIVILEIKTPCKLTKIPTLMMEKAFVLQLVLKAKMKLFKRNPYPLLPVAVVNL